MRIMDNWTIKNQFGSVVRKEKQLIFVYTYILCMFVFLCTINNTIIDNLSIMRCLSNQNLFWVKIHTPQLLYFYIITCIFL